LRESKITMGGHNASADKVYEILARLYATLHAAGITVDGVVVTEPPELKAEITAAIQAVRTS
jgi:hypothetical protein